MSSVLADQSRLDYDSKYGGRGGGEGRGLRGLSQLVQLCTWSPNKLWRSNSVERLNCKRPIPIGRHFFKIDLLTNIAALCLTDFIDWKKHSLIGWYFRPSLCTVAPMEEGTILVYCCPSIFSLTSSTLPKLNVLFIQTVCV
jgi:hypothetical protein